MNINKIFTFYSLTLLIIFSCALNAHEPIEYTDREWDYLEKMLIIKPAQDALQQARRNRWYTPFLGFGLASCITGHLLMADPRNEKDIDCILTVGHIGFWIGVIFFIKYKNREHEKLVYENFLEIVEQWPKHKKYIPECFHPALNDCFEFFRTHGSKDPEWQKKANAIIDVLHQAIKNHFVQKYYRLSLFI